MNYLNLTIDLQLLMFDQTIMPILTYDWAFLGLETRDMLGKIHIDYFSKKDNPMQAK